MKKGSQYTYVYSKRSNEMASEPLNRGGKQPQQELDLNVFVLTFDGAKEAQKNLAGGDHYACKKCGAILNKYSIVLRSKDFLENPYELKPTQSLWKCEFCNYANRLLIEKEEIPVKDDVVYMLESALEQEGVSENDSTIVFCIDISGSMNTTAQIAGKVDLKFGLSKEEIEMLKQFMEPGDEAQFHFLPGAHNKNKTFVSRIQCVLSAIESQINQIRKADPHRKVGFILFNNEVLVLGDGKAENVSLVGDRLNNPADIMNALKEFKLTSSIAQNFQPLLNQLNKTQAKGQTALGPALTAAIEVASKGSKGSIVVLCTDGLANVGVGALDSADESTKNYYQMLSKQAKNKNVSVNIITIKGESSKLAILGQVVEATNGNIKVVNPQKLSQDFANILKDEVIGVDVQTKIMLHKALVFRHEEPANLKDNKTILVKKYANATINTKISFEYEVRSEDDLKFMEIDILKLQKVPFQAQITYTSLKGGRFLRVITSQSKTTTERSEMESSANIGVVHQRIASNTAQLYSRGEGIKSISYNNMWSGYMNNNFSAPQYAAQQEKFNSRNRRLNEAISNKIQKEEVSAKTYNNEMILPLNKKEISDIKQQEFSIKSEKSSFKEKSIESSIKKVEELQPSKTGYFGVLSSKKEPSKAVASIGKKRSALLNKREEKKQKQVDSDEDEMQFKNYMMEKNEDFD